jgi:hypothetical protein
MHIEIHWFNFHTLEQEHFDIFAQYRLGEVDSILAQRPMATSLSLEVLARNSITLGMIWMR